ncbi:MAG: (2Fe-2S)-binding protein [Deltaproteobacteria bacterium]|nr:MAG: (2Fe-2S)-binding protein [Deltaproteobacteria bacterium]
MKTAITITVNGERHSLEVKPNSTLVDVLRDQLGLRGTKKGCGEGKCGSCTVLLDGLPVSSCILLAVQADGREVVTIEGLGERGRPHPLQKAFVERGAVQCGYCTPGMIVTAKALLESNPSPDERIVRKAIAGNLCRCTGYTKIVDAILSLADRGSELVKREKEDGS